MSDDTLRELEESIAALANGTKNPREAVREARPQPPQRPRLAAPTMKLPEGLAREAAIIVFEFWEQQSGRTPVSWDALPTRYQMMWVEITRVVLEMTVTVQLTDIHRFFEQSNGDMGHAFAAALRRYAGEILNTRVTP
jgi:hypothetical protein